MNKYAGRPNTSTIQKALDEICMSLEKDSELLDLDDLRNKMVKACEADVDTVKRIKQKLQEFYQENIFFAELNGRKNVVCFKTMAELIKSDKWYSFGKSDKVDEARRLIQKVAKLIKCSMRNNLSKEKAHSHLPKKCRQSEYLKP